MRKLIVVSLAILGFAMLPQTTRAGVLTGTLDIGGSVKVDNLGNIDWGSNGPPSGVLTIANTSTFADGGVVINSGTITDKDLTAAGQPTSGFAPLDAFELTGAPNPTINFILADINSCAEIVAGGYAGSCDAGGTSPFTFSQTTVPIPGGSVTNSTIIMSMSGTAFDVLTPGLVATWSGVWTAQFPGQTIAQLLGQLTGSPGFIDTSFSASKIIIQQPTAVPEPATLLTFGVGSGLLALRRRRKAAKAAAQV